MYNPILRVRFAWMNWKRDFPLYFRTIRLNPEFGRVDSAPAWECEYPYREGTSMVFRVAGRFGITIGVMNNHTDMTDKAINRRLFRAVTGTDGGEDYVRKVQESMENWLEEDDDRQPVPYIRLEDTIDPEE